MLQTMIRAVGMNLTSYFKKFQEINKISGFSLKFYDYSYFMAALEF